jgi:hypothetical protein
MELIFRGPDGRRGPVEDIDDVIHQIREAGTDYWNVNAGDAGLIRREGDEERRLSIYFLPLGPGAIQLIWRGDGKEELLSALPARPPARPTWVDIQVGGNPKRISSGQALTRREAEQVIRHFAEHGSRDPRHEWVTPKWPFVG